jgi:dUTP pyrophosphatase
MMLMKVRVKRFDKTLPLPEYKTSGAAAMDLYSRIDAVIQPRETVVLPTNIAMETPEGYVAFVLPRSGVSLKTPLRVANAPGTVDSDFRGDADEIGVIMQNTGDRPITIKRGERIAQLAIIPVEKVLWDEVDSLENENRGGFGTTGM